MACVLSNSDNNFQPFVYPKTSAWFSTISHSFCPIFTICLGRPRHCTIPAYFHISSKVYSGSPISFSLYSYFRMFKYCMFFQRNYIIQLNTTKLLVGAAIFNIEIWTSFRWYKYHSSNLSAIDLRLYRICIIKSVSLFPFQIQVL